MRRLSNFNGAKPLLFAYAKTKTQIRCAVIAQMISVLVFPAQLVQNLFFLNPKISSLIPSSEVVRTPETGFIRDAAQLISNQIRELANLNIFTDGN